ncbi:hypothetical protein [Psychromonas antarctica]|jgi:uncharacterized protein (TIGR03503 family)|uniref:hypothetical protein n=1 Tax=Psychromonas antarctica TaxID=67573 RepID=UPI001EE8F7EA|nr:hypothetical protein [Psychromonas antarctica]MCG6201007.1 hypothetical protein [Psychromonas antarctica]
MREIISCFLLCIITSASLAHTIYAQNDIPLLDNRVRIDPYTEQVTFILNHASGSQLVVLVRPDGSKLYAERHPDTVGWVSSKTADIITIDKPMAGPWQAVAQLDGDNRIKLISNVELKTDRLPLKLYSQEYITTNASLYYDNQLMTEQAYLDNAKLSVRLIKGADKQLTLYQDDGKGYDALPFDGKLTAHVYIDLPPGRYLLNIRTKNDIFIRNINKDVVVFPTPISYQLHTIEDGSKEMVFEFKIDSDEIMPDSVTIDGVIKDSNNKVIEQLIAHSAGNLSIENKFTTNKTLAYGVFSLSGKAFATTLSGREIELQLPKQQFELLPLFIMHEVIASEPKIETIALPIWKKIWFIGTVSAICFFILLAIILLVRRKRKRNGDLLLSELKLDELSPTPIDIKEGNK